MLHTIAVEVHGQKGRRMAMCNGTCKSTNEAQHRASLGHSSNYIKDYLFKKIVFSHPALSCMPHQNNLFTDSIKKYRLQDKLIKTKKYLTITAVVELLKMLFDFYVNVSSTNLSVIRVFNLENA